MYRNAKVKLYLKVYTKRAIESTFRACRYVYNQGIDYYQTSINNGESFNLDCLKEEIKRDRQWHDTVVYNIDGSAINSVYANLEDAIYRYEHYKDFGFPKKKSINDEYSSYKTYYAEVIDEKHIKLPKIGIVKTSRIPIVDGKLINAVVILDLDGKYYCSLCFDVEGKQIKKNDGGIIGLDMGIKHYYTDSNGEILDFPEELKNAWLKCTKEKHKMSNMKVGSSNWKKQQAKIGKIKKYIINKRMEWQKIEAEKILQANKLVCIEDLNMRSMIAKSNSFTQAQLKERAIGTFLRLLERNAYKYGTTVIRVPWHFASSQICSKCGFQNTELKDITIREWDCPNCGAHHDRDINAATNILNKGLEMWGC